MAPSDSTWRTPFSTAGNELPRDRAAHHFVDELESRAALERLDPQEHFAELARAAGLFLVPAVAFGRARDGFAVGNARRMGFDVHAIALRHALEQHPQVQLAHAVDHRLVHRRVMLDTDARILGHELVERIGQPLLVAAPLRLDRDAEHRRRKDHRLQVEVVLVVRVVQDRIEVQLFQLGDGADVARNRVAELPPSPCPSA